MNDFANEQLLTEVVATVYDMFPDINVMSIKCKFSNILNKYNVEIGQVINEETDLMEKIDIYIVSKKLEGLSNITLKNYKAELTNFTKNTKKKTNNVTSADIRNYLSKNENIKMSTMGTKLTIFKSFFGWLYCERIIENNPTLNLKSPKVENRMPKSLSIEELELMRESCATVRQRTFLEIMYATGCRLNEIRQLNISDIDFQTNSCKVIGKGNKEREVYFSFKAIYYMKKYLNNRTDTCEALMISERKPYRRLSNRAIEREIGKVGSNAGLKVSPHDLRRTFGMLTLNNGASLIAVQELLGHKSPESTLKYARITEERKREQHKKYLVQ